MALPAPPTCSGPREPILQIELHALVAAHLVDADACHGMEGIDVDGLLRRLGDLLGVGVSQARELQAIELQAGDLEQAEGQLPLALRRPLDDALLGKVEQQPMHRSERQAELHARRHARPAGPYGPAGPALVSIA